jgi:hypothetical protein
MLVLAAPAVLGSGCTASVIDSLAEEAFLAGLGNTTLTVFPAFVRAGEEAQYDADAAPEIGVCFTDHGLATVTVADAEIPITGSWGMNEAKMFNESATEFAAYVQVHPIDTEYALLAEYLQGGAGAFLGIHCYVVDAQGRVAWGALWNSHFEAFVEAAPETSADCTGMLTQELPKLLEATEAGP